uniref:Uncharacterized protein n=1 Tax=Avena sativa TaxID=4498 RepID=A0ACD5YBM9_AVESA
MPLTLFHRGLCRLPPAANFRAIKSARTAAHSTFSPSAPTVRCCKWPSATQGRASERERSQRELSIAPLSCRSRTMPLPGSWFYKLRRRRRSVASGQADDDDEEGDDAVAWAASKPRGDRALAEAAALPAPPCSPNRASYYVPSRDRVPAKGNPKRLDTQFPRSPQHNDIVFDVVTVRQQPTASDAGRFDGIKAMPELKLRPILTKKIDGVEGFGSDGSSGAASPTARLRRRRRRLHAKPSSGRKGDAAAAAGPRSRRARRRRWLRESLVVVKESAEPEEDFLASMAEMIAANEDVRASPRGLEELLACYLALNAAEHHRAIVGAFARAWLALDTTTGTTKPQRSNGAAAPSICGRSRAFPCENYGGDRIDRRGDSIFAQITRTVSV